MKALLAALAAAVLTATLSIAGPAGRATTTYVAVDNSAAAGLAYTGES